MKYFVAAVLACLSTSVFAGSQNVSINGWNFVALDSVVSLNYAVLADDRVRFDKLVEPGAMISGMAQFDKGADVRPLAMETLKIVLSKCIANGLKDVASNSATLQLSCVGKTRPTAEFRLNGRNPAKVLSVKIGVFPPTVTTSAPVSDD